MNTNFGKKNRLQKDLADVIHHLQKHFSSFAIIQHFLRHLENELDSPDNLQQIVNEYRYKWSNNMKELINKAISYVTDFINKTGSYQVCVLAQHFKMRLCLFQIQEKNNLRGT